MYITEVLTKTTTGKIAHRCILLCESYREHGKVKTRTLANLTHCPPYDGSCTSIVRVIPSPENQVKFPHITPV